MTDYTSFISVLTDTIVDLGLQTMEIYKTEEKHQIVCSSQNNCYMVISFSKVAPISLTITPFFKFSEQALYLRPQKVMGSEPELLGWAKDNLRQAASLASAFITIIDNFRTLVEESGLKRSISDPALADRGQGVECIWRVEDMIGSYPVIIFFKVRLTNRAIVLKARFEGDEWFTLKTGVTSEAILQGIEGRVRSTVGRLNPDVMYYIEILKKPGCYGDNVVAFPRIYTKINIT